MRHAVLNFVAAWRQVSQATALHSWQALTPQFCQEEQAAPVSAASLAKEVATLAQSVPGSSRVTAEEVKRAATAQIPSTVQDVVNDVDRTEEEESTQQEQQREGRRGGCNL